MTTVTFLGVLWPPVTGVNPSALAVAVVAVFTAVHWMGLRLGSSLTEIISAVIAILLMTVVVCCFFVAPAADAATAIPPNSAAALPWMSTAMILAVVPALRAILTAFDGWYSPIYMAEENKQPVRTLPRAIIGGTLLISTLYLLINLAFVRVLPMPALAASKLPAEYYEFHHALRIALEIPDAETRWLAGEDIFADVAREIVSDPTAQASNRRIIDQVVAGALGHELPA